MALTAKQHAQIATTYQEAAVDYEGDWFRMLAQIAAKKEAAMEVERLTHLLLVAQGAKKRSQM